MADLDPRIIRTRSKIKNSLLKLYTLRIPLEHITVVDICNDCKVNRTTFYLHYYCVSDVIKDILLDVEEDIRFIYLQHNSELSLEERLGEYFVKNADRINLVKNESKVKWIAILNKRVKKILFNFKPTAKRK